MIDIKDLHKRFGKNEVLKGINIRFDEPKISAILGPNGSGKTTLIKSLLGMVIPDKGTITIQDSNIKNEWNYRDQISYLPQIARFPENLKVSELFKMLKDLRPRKADDLPLIERFEVNQFIDKRLGNLSGGMRQKVNLVLAFMYDNPILILDEPTAGLDPVALISLKELIREQKAMGKTILMTTHIMSLVEEIADEVIYLLEGRIYFRGSIKELKKEYHGNNTEMAIANILRKEEHKHNGQIKDYAEIN